MFQLFHTKIFVVVVFCLTTEKLGYFLINITLAHKTHFNSYRALENDWKNSLLGRLILLAEPVEDGGRRSAGGGVVRGGVVVVVLRRPPEYTTHSGQSWPKKGSQTRTVTSNATAVDRRRRRDHQRRQAAAVEQRLDSKVVANLEELSRRVLQVLYDQAGQQASVTSTAQQPFGVVAAREQPDRQAGQPAGGQKFTGRHHYFVAKR